MALVWGNIPLSLKVKIVIDFFREIVRNVSEIWKQNAWNSLCFISEISTRLHHLWRFNLTNFTCYHNQLWLKKCAEIAEVLSHAFLAKKFLNWFHEIFLSETEFLRESNVFLKKLLNWFHEIFFSETEFLRESNVFLKKLLTKFNDWIHEIFLSETEFLRESNVFLKKLLNWFHEIFSVRQNFSFFQIVK